MRVDIISGFLGAGKTTLARKLLREAVAGQKIVMIENEFGEIGIDGGFLEEYGIELREMNSGCICCSLVGDFQKALTEVISQYAPDRIWIEPSGVGKLSDVLGAVEKVCEKNPDLELGFVATVVDVQRGKRYLRNFGEFFADQIAHAQTVVLSRSQLASEVQVEEVLALLRSHNLAGRFLTTPWDDLDGKDLMQFLERGGGWQDLRQELQAEGCAQGHDHHGHDCCGSGHGSHGGGHGECVQVHDHHVHDCCGHGHGSHGGGHGECAHGHHHGSHTASQVFDSWGLETPRLYDREALEAFLAALDGGSFGLVLRAKGMVAGQGQWWYFDHVPGDSRLWEGKARAIGALCVLGKDLDKQALEKAWLGIQGEA